MKIDVKEINGEICTVIQNVYCNTVLETAEGNQVAICMRDDTIEFNILKFDKWYRINMQTGEVNRMD